MVLKRTNNKNGCASQPCESARNRERRELGSSSGPIEDEDNNDLVGARR